MFGAILIIDIILILSITIRINFNKVKVLLSENFIYDYEIIIGLYLFNKIRAVNIKIDKEKIKQMNLKNKIKPEQIEKLKKEAPNKKELKDMLKSLKVHCTEFDFNAEIDTSNVMLTTGVVTLISTIISILLSIIIKERKNTEYKYKITPLYTSKNMLKIDFKSIINVKMVHIIYIIYIFIKKRRDDKHERTSNRRSYDYSYE